VRYSQTNIETNLTNRAFAVDAIALVNLNVRKIAPILNFTARSRRHQLASVTEDHPKRFAKLLVVLLITQASILLYQEAKARYTNRGDSIPRQFLLFHACCCMWRLTLWRATGYRHTYVFASVEKYRTGHRLRHLQACDEHLKATTTTVSFFPDGPMLPLLAACVCPCSSFSWSGTPGNDEYFVLLDNEEC
jgi:hypothetical protein